MRPCWMVYQLLLLFALEGKMNEDFFGNLGDSSDKAESHWAETRNQEFNPSVVLAFVPARSCHLQFSGDHGTFSPPIFHGNLEVNLWCNWTVLAAPGKHIVIYITGFKTNETCSENHDEIIFEGVSSSVENTIIYACWNKHIHVFATEATALSVVLLWRSFSNTGSKRYFYGRYYVFDDPVLRPNTDSGSCSLTSKQNISTSNVIQVPTDHLLTMTTHVTRTMAQSLWTTYNPLMSHLPAVMQSLELGVYEGHTDLPTADDLEPSQIGKLETMSQFIWSQKTAHSEILSETPSLTATQYTDLLGALHLGITSNLPETQQLNKDQSVVDMNQNLIRPTTTSIYVHTINATEQRNQHSTAQMSPYFSIDSATRSDETVPFSIAHTVSFQESSYSFIQANVPGSQHLSTTDRPGHQHLVNAHATDPPEASLIDLLNEDFPETSFLSDIFDTSEIHTTKFIELSHLDQTIKQVSITPALEFSKTLKMPPNNGIQGKTDNADSDNLEPYTLQAAPASAAPLILPSMIRTSDLGFHMEHSTPQSAIVTVDQQLMLDGVASHPAPEIPNELIYSKSALQITGKIETVKKYISSESPSTREVTRTLVEPTKELNWWTVKEDLEATDSTSRISTHPVSYLSSSRELFSNTFLNTFEGIESHDTFTQPYPQPTDDSVSNMEITTVELVNLVKERSTYSYRTNSDLDLQQNVAGQPRGSYLNVEDVTYFFGNLSDLEFVHEPGDSLFVITTEIEHQDVVLRGFEKDLVKSVREKIIERMVYFPSGVNSLILKEIRWKNVYKVTLTFWLHLIQGGKEMRNFLKTQLKTLESYPLGSSNAKLVSFTVEDVNECQLGIQNCHINAHCVNMVGSYSCHCMDGYEDHSSDAPGIVCISSKPAEIHSLSEHLEILIGAMVTAVVAVVLVVIILCIVQQKRRAKVNFGLQDPLTREHEPHAPGDDHHGQVGLPLSIPSRHLSPRHGREHHTATETSSALELTKITIEQAAC